jgi:hypothetical protein
MARDRESCSVFHGHKKMSGKEADINWKHSDSNRVSVAAIFTVSHSPFFQTWKRDFKRPGDSSQSRHRPFPKMMPNLGALAFPRRWTLAKKFFESVMNTSVGTGRSDGTLWCQMYPLVADIAIDLVICSWFTYSKWCFFVAMLVYQRVVILKEKREDIITF